MSQDEFTRLFKYIEKRFDDMDKKFDHQREDFSVLTSAVDGYAKKVDDATQEMLMLAHKVDRLERWINQIAAKTGVKLEY